MNDRPKPQPSQELRRVLVDHAITLGLIALVVALAYRIFSPLFPAILWGLLLAVICAHPYERLVSRLRGRRQLADLVFAIVLLLVLLVPAAFFSWELITNFPAVSAWLEQVSSRGLPAPPDWLAQLPVLGPTIESAWGQADAETGGSGPNIVSSLGNLATWTAGRIGSFGAFVFEFVLGAIISLFILHNRFAVRAFLNRLAGRLGGKFAAGLFTSALDTTRTAFTAVIYAAIAQTLLAGIGLYVAGLPALVLFAGFTFLLALVQIGPFVVLLVAEAILLSTGSYLAGVLLAAWFLGVVMTVDNVIRPYFTSQGSNVPGIITFLGTVGGLLSWGLIGVFVGPVLTAVIYEMLLAWIEGDQKDEPGPSGTAA
ncbi:AI-2E family transporter [Rhodobacterales bacterium HKCCE3408]|nr:AI-2E family transporter [Rhodobacterales bacterium HKCCE3408]